MSTLTLEKAKSILQKYDIECENLEELLFDMDQNSSETCVVPNGPVYISTGCTPNGLNQCQSCSGSSMDICVNYEFNPAGPDPVCAVVPD